MSVGQEAYRRPALRPALRTTVLALVPLVVLCACAGTPRAKSAADARVSGSLSLEFPDGTRFLRSTADGHFSFPAAGGEELRLVRYEYSLAGPDFSCYLNDDIGISFRPQPGEALDLGNIRIRYTGPRPADRVTFARSTTVEEDEPPVGEPGARFRRLRQSYWRYERAVLR